MTTFIISGLMIFAGVFLAALFMRDVTRVDDPAPFAFLSGALVVLGVMGVLASVLQMIWPT